MFRSDAVKVNRDLKDEIISIEGKWANVRNIVQDLLDDGWRIKGEATGEPSGFKFTEVTLTR